MGEVRGRRGQKLEDCKVNWLTSPTGPARLVGPLDRSLARLSAAHPGSDRVRSLRWFWLDGLFSNISISFYTSFVPLLALAYGANNTQIGQLTAISSLCGLAALLPGAEVIKLLRGRRKTLVLLSGAVGRVSILGWLFLPLLVRRSEIAIALIIGISAVITFANNFANPAWTAVVADIVPREIRGRFFSHRNIAVNLPTLLVVPLAGWLIQNGNRPGFPFGGYQIVFFLAFLTGAAATWAYSRIADPGAPAQALQGQPLAQAMRIIGTEPGFVSLVACTLIWNLGAQMTGPFLNVYIVSELGGTASWVGWVTAAGGLAALIAQRWLGRWVDQRGSVWVQGVLSFLLPWVPLAWMVATAPWHVLIVNAVAGILWAGYGLASFNLLLDFAPEQARAEANALYQLVVAGSAVLAPAVGGRLADAHGYGPIFVVSCVLRVLGALAFVVLIGRPGLRRRRRGGAEA